MAESATKESGISATEPEEILVPAESSAAVHNRAEVSRSQDAEQKKSILAEGSRKFVEKANDDLYKAMFVGDQAKIQQALDEGADVNAKFELGYTALHIAMIIGNYEILDLLLKNNASSDTLARSGMSPLHIAARTGSLREIQCLLASGCKIDVADNDGWTALMWCCQRAHTEAAELLLQKGADMNRATKDGRTPLMMVASQPATGMLDFLLRQNPTLNAVDMDGWTALQYACSFGKLETVDRLIKQGLDVNHRDDTGWTPLHHALQNGTERAKIFQRLREAKAKITATDDTQETPLHVATKEQCSEIVKHLLDAKDGLPVDALNKDGWTALHIASSHGNDELVKMLLDKALAVERALSISDGELAGEQTEIGRVSSAKATVTRLVKGSSPSEKQLIVRTLDEEGSIDKVTHMLEMATLDAEESRLIWFASRPKKHEGVTKILQQQKMKTTAETPLNLAAFHGLVKVVWWLLATTDKSEEKVARDRISAAKYAEARKTSYEKQLKEEQAGKSMDKVKGHSDKDEKYELPKLAANLEDTVKDIKPTIVDFYCHDARVDFLWRSRTIQDIIYSLADQGGPEKIMDEARRTLKDIDSESLVYKSQDLKLRWIHLPANNMKWLEDLTLRIYLDNKKTKKEYTRVRNFLHRSWREFGTGNFNSKHMKPTCSKIPVPVPGRKELNVSGNDSANTRTNASSSEGRKQDAAEGKGESEDGQQTRKTKPPKPEQYDCTALYMPYLTFGKFYKAEEPHLQNNTGENLWIWVVDEKTIITSSTQRNDDFEDPVVGRILKHLEDQQKTTNGRPPPSSVKEMVGFIAQFCIRLTNTITWGNSKSEKEKDSAFLSDATEKSAIQIFADTIHEKSAEEKRLFHSFKEKMRGKVDESTSPVLERRSDKVEQGAQRTTEESEANKSETSKHKQESKDWSSISEAAVLLHEVKDIREELRILESLLKQQSSVWKAIPKLDAGQSADAKGPEYLLEEIKEMCKNTETIQNSVNEVLTLEQNGIGITEAVLARNQADESARQGKTLMIFTIVTIVFTPMSFLSSLFALNVSSFQHDDEGNLRYNPGWIFPLLFCVSIAITIPLLTIAIYVEDIRSMIKAGWVNLWKPRDIPTAKPNPVGQTDSLISSGTSRRSKQVVDLEGGTGVRERT
ncbi:uncharacterized protein BDV14DRAFT_194476 [Aspergillus stella-maris]|uniref:uncharacterized protein n=1 Tax=Aspergillus stella-maris TaxID=1810926 RepID=UPI003CCD5DBB